VPQVVTVDVVHRACRPASSPPLSHSLTKPVQRLEAQPDEDFGTIPKPDPDLATKLADRAASWRAPKNIEDTRAKLKRLVKLDILTEIDTGSFARKQ